MLVFSIIVVTILQLHSVFWCGRIPIAEPVRMWDTRIMERCNVKPKNNSEKLDAASVKMVYPPEGTGLFRDPLEVLGPLFPTKKSINTCEVHMTLTANTVSEVRFTKRGEKVCRDVCKQYRTNMITDGPVDVKLMDGYCNYSNDAKTLDQIDFATTCTCVYRVKCDSTSFMIVYSFQANSAGFLKVIVSDSNVLLPVT